MRKLVKCSRTNSSVSLFDADRKNEFGEMHCVAPLILPRDVEKHWEEYKQQLTACNK